jgi:hypothetical protein
MRAGDGRLRPLLDRGYRVAAQVGAGYLLRGDPASSVYVRGGVGTTELLPGVSDIDLAIVTAERSSAELARRRWQRLRRRLPLVERLMDWPRIYQAGELAALAGTSAYTWGLGDSSAASDAAGYAAADLNLDRLRALERPGLYGPADDWRPLRGPDRRPVETDRDPQDRRIAAWLELLYLWRLALPACVHPRRAYVPLLCVKLVAEAARIWLLLERGERASVRADALRRALSHLPEEEDALRMALDLERRLPQAPHPPLAEALAALVRFSSRIAGLISSEVGERGTLQVRLAGADSPPPLPLCDWRNVVLPGLGDETFVPVTADLQPDSVGELVARSTSGAYPALRAEGLVILLGSPLARTRLRAIKSPVTDPAVFAVVAGERVARFPEVRGWSAEDTARRAVAEHRGRLHRSPPERGCPALAFLLGAARAALFLESVRAGEPELCLTMAETVRKLAVHSPAAASAAGEALGGDDALDHDHLTEPPPSAIAALRETVLGLPPYGREPSGPRASLSPPPGR